MRPRWEDGTAHTVKKFGIVNRYDLQREFPILTLRRTYWKSAVDELLWIWQKKAITSTTFLPHLGCLGGRGAASARAYGYQLGVKHQYKRRGCSIRWTACSTT